jgi:hypothetical protein
VRNRIVLVLSGAQLEEVKERGLVEQTNAAPTPLNGEDLDDDGKACKVHGRLIRATAKGTFYNAYLVSFPLQVVIITSLIVHKMFTEQYTVESCETFMTIYNDTDTDQKLYYDCSYRRKIDNTDEVEKYCSGNMSYDNFTKYNIDCTQYYFETGKLIEAVVLGYSAHLLLSKILIYFVHLLHFLVRRTAPIRHNGVRSCRDPRVLIPGVLLIMVLLIPVIGCIVLTILFILRNVSDMIREKTKGIQHDNRVWDILTYSGWMILPTFLAFVGIVFFKFRFLDKEYRPCLTHVSCIVSEHQPFAIDELVDDGNNTIQSEQTQISPDDDRNQSARDGHSTTVN